MVGPEREGVSALPTHPSHTVNTQYTRMCYLHVVWLYFFLIFIFIYFYSFYYYCKKQNAKW